MKENHQFNIRFAVREDASLILSFIHKLAKYEHMEDEVVATSQLIEESLFDHKEAEVLIAEVDNQPIGFALFYKTYSTFLGQSNYYLEDLYINKDARGNGYGKQILTFLADTVYKRGAHRLEWVCLNWNQPSIDFYQGLGAKKMSEWSTFRLSGDSLKRLASQNQT